MKEPCQQWRDFQYGDCLFFVDPKKVRDKNFYRNFRRLEYTLVDTTSLVGRNEIIECKASSQRLLSSLEL